MVPITRCVPRIVVQSARAGGVTSMAAEAAAATNNAPITVSPGIFSKR